MCFFLMSRYDDSHPEPSLKEKEPVRIGQLHHRDVETDDNVGVVVDDSYNHSKVATDSDFSQLAEP